VDVRTHRIGEVINKILDEDWEDPPEEEEINTNRWKWFWPISRKGPPKGGEPEPAPTPQPGKKNPNAVPKAEPEDACVDCFKW
jgi:lipase ATG15